MNLSRWPLAFAIILFLLFVYSPAIAQPIAPPAFPRQIDIVYLKDGSIIQGTIIENKTDDYLKIRNRNGSEVIVGYSNIMDIERRPDTGKTIDVKSRNCQYDLPSNRKNLEDSSNLGGSFSFAYGNGFRNPNNFGEMGARIMDISDNHAMVGFSTMFVGQYLNIPTEPYAFTFACEVGYAFLVHRFAICPYIEPGFEYFFYDTLNAGTDFCISPGLLAQWSLRSGIKFGIDAKYSFVGGGVVSNASMFSLAVFFTPKFPDQSPSP